MEIKKIPELLKVATTLQSRRNLSDSEIHSLLDAADKQIKKLKGKEKTYHKTLFFRLLLSIGDISRQHQYLKENGIISPTGGFGQVTTFRSILRWLESNHKKFFYDNLQIWVEHTSISTLIYNSIKTDRNNGTVLSSEYMDFDQKKVAKFLANYYKKGNLTLVAKHLPKHVTKFERTNRHKVKRDGATKVPKGKSWYKLNDKNIEPKQENDGAVVHAKKGDIIKYPRPMGLKTIEKCEKNNILISLFCKEMGWKIDGKSGRYPKYDEFRKNQNTVEQKMSSKSILGLDKTQLYSLFNSLPTKARDRFSKSVCYKDENGNYQPKPKWAKIAKVFIEWQLDQENIAKEVREESDPITRSTKVKQLKLKTVGITTASLLEKLIKEAGSNYNKNNFHKMASGIDADYTAMIQKMSFLVPAAVWIDISGSMNGTMYTGNGEYLSRLQVATGLAVTFSTNDPSHYRNQVGIFSRNATLVSSNKYVKKNIPQNPYIFDPHSYTETDSHAVQILSEKDAFSANFKRLYDFLNQKRASGDWTASTDPSQAFKWHMENYDALEDLPQVLLMVSDGEFNSNGNAKRSLTAAMKKANDIGWYPLVILWDIVGNGYDMDMENVLHLGGFNESVLTQIISNLKIGSIDPYKQLVAINDDPRYQMLTC